MKWVCDKDYVQVTSSCEETCKKEYYVTFSCEQVTEGTAGNL
jgi:hypothetical protein